MIPISDGSSRLAAPTWPMTSPPGGRVETEVGPVDRLRCGG